MNRKRAILITAIFVLLTLPQAFLGYGHDNDAWRVAATADHIWAEGRYLISRTTGFPLFELSITPFVHAGSWILSNAFVLLFGLGFLASFLRLSGKGRLSHPVPAVACTALLPAVITNASSTMDYIPALALLMWAYVMMIEGRLTPAAILIGIACGFRPSSGLFVIPVIAYCMIEKRPAAAVARFFVLSLAVGCAAYSPVLIMYGLQTPFGAIKLDPTAKILIGGYNSLRLFGIAQSAVLIPVLLIAGFRNRRRSGFVIFHATNITVWLIAYAVMPVETAYLLPIVPSVMLLLDAFSSRKLFVCMTVLLLSYNVVQLDLLGGESGDRRITPSIQPGYTVQTIQDRLFKLSTRTNATALETERPTVLMLGVSWIPAVNKEWILDETHGMYRQKHGNLFVSERILDEHVLADLRKKGFRLVVWNQAKWEYIRTRNEAWKEHVEIIHDLEEFFGAPVRGRALTER